MQQTLTLSVGAKYMFSFKVRVHASGGGARTLYAGMGTTDYFSLTLTEVGTSVGVQSATFTAAATNLVLFFSANGDTGGAGNCK